MRSLKTPEQRISLPAGEIHVMPDPMALAEEAARHFIAAAHEAIAARNAFNVALAGGSTPAALYRLMADDHRSKQIDWRHTFLYFGDERCVPPDHADSNYRMVHEILLKHVAVPDANIYRMAGEKAPQEAAQIYDEILQRNLGGGGRLARFDLILLGMGEDGHTASLFPGTDALNEHWRWVTAVEAPAYVRPAVSRITLTLPILNEAAHIVYLVAGASKAKPVAQIWAGPALDSTLPAGRVQPQNGSLVWLLDEAAAAGLHRRSVEE